MKNMRLNSIMAGGVLLLGMYGCTPKVQDYSSYVNPFIGTGGHGHTYPGAIVPNGMIHAFISGMPVRVIIMQILPLTGFRIRISAVRAVEIMVTYC